MTSKILELIEHLPIWLNVFLMRLNKNANLIYGKKYSQYNKFVKNNAMQYDNSHDLVSIINHAVKSVPYYRKRYSQIDNIEEFHKQFKCIDKDIISDNINDFLSDDIDMSKFILGTTSGTGGNPLKMYLPKNRHIVELGTMHYLWENVGFHHDIRAVIRRKKLADNVNFIINPITKEIIFDGFRLNDDYFNIIYSVIHRFQVPYIHAYPSTAYEFSKFVVKNKLDLSFVKSFLSGSENVYEYQKQFIRNKAKVNFYNWYGHSEKLILAGYCKYSDNYHIEPTYGYFELIDEDGNQVTTPGQEGEIVGTTLHNYGMPMIRYKTGDYAEYVGDYCEHCQRNVPLIKNIEGRKLGLKVYGADESVINIIALRLPDDLYTYLGGVQYVQKEKGKLDVLIIKGDKFTQEHDKQLKDFYRSRLSDNMIIRIQYVYQLLRKPNGKFIELMSEIKE